LHRALHLAAVIAVFIAVFDRMKGGQFWKSRSKQQRTAVFT
jgi:hypothetical protein